MNTVNEPGLSELTRLGIEFYEEQLKTLLEPTHNGEFVAIEPYSGQYFLEKKKTGRNLKSPRRNAG